MDVQACPDEALENLNLGCQRDVRYGSEVNWIVNIESGLLQQWSDDCILILLGTYSFLNERLKM